VTIPGPPLSFIRFSAGDIAKSRITIATPDAISPRRRVTRGLSPIGTRHGLCDTADLTGEEITVRRCRYEDAPAVLELWTQARSEHASTADRLEDVERLIGDSPAALLVAECGDEIVGALIAGWDGWRGNMYRLAVREGDRRQGIGIALARAGEAYLRGRGVRRVTALVAFEDDAAEAFWEAAGYPQDREIGRRVRNL
jgi:ribosomal protein S18 acetylase RimI-like enzyme